MHSDLVVIGGGIVGLATAYRFTQRFPGKRVVVLEKEPRVAQHQTGRNSGVLHSGIYYTPGSLKATNCLAGKHALEEFCATHKVPFETCGKVIVAVEESERPALERIYQRGQANSVPCEIIGVERLRELEPHTRGVAAIHVPSTGIIDYIAVCDRLVDCLLAVGGEVITGAKATGFIERDQELVVQSTRGEFITQHAVNCSGLHCDQIARLSGQATDVRIIPFRGEYFELRPLSHHLVKNLIYPTPDPSFPFLGVHFTRMIAGGVECGPNAVLAFAREGYEKTSVNWSDLAGTLTYPGFVKLAFKYWKTGAGEMWRSVSKHAFVRALQRLVPEISAEDLTPVLAGVRAQAVKPDGTLVDDFLIAETPRVVNVLNAPSPAATAALNIGLLVVDRLASRY